MQQSADILVTGATGRIGAVLRRYWPAGRVVWQSRRPGPGFTCFDPLAHAHAYGRAAPSARTILCLAGVVTPRDGASGFDANVDLALAAVRAGAETGAHVFLSSSAAVYGRGQGPLRETGPLAPESDYAAAKARMEGEAQSLGARLGVGVTSLRIGNIAGLDAILGGWRPGFRLDRFDNGLTPRRSYVGVKTLADVLLTVTEARPGGALNIAQPHPVEMGRLLDAAGLGWHSRAAPRDAIDCVDLAVDRLQALLPAPLPSADPEDLVAEWRDFRQEAPA